MRGNQLGGRYLPQQRFELAPAPRVEVARRLVQHQDARLARQHPGEAGAAFLPVTQMMRGAVAETRQARLRQGLLHVNATDNLRKLGIQVGGTNGVTWQGNIYIKSALLVNQVLVVPPPPITTPVWVIANFDSASNGGKQGFYVPSWATGTLTRANAILFGKTSGSVLQASVSLSPSAPQFAAVRDSVVMQKSDSIVTSLTCSVYLPPSMPVNAIVKLYVNGGANDSVAVADTVGKQITRGQWTTLAITKLDSLAGLGKFDPTKAARIGVAIYYPGSLDTTQWLGKVEFDDFTAYGIWFANGVPSGVKGDAGVVYQYQLYSNYPNPFNPSTTIKYDVQMNSKVLIKVFDILGREVATLVDRKQAAGSYEVEFNASSLSSGVYFVRMNAGGFVKTQRMMLLK